MQRSGIELAWRQRSMAQCSTAKLSWHGVNAEWLNAVQQYLSWHGVNAAWLNAAQQYL